MGPNTVINFRLKEKRNLFSQHVCDKLHHAKNTCLEVKETFYRWLTVITGGEIDKKSQFGQGEKYQDHKLTNFIFYLLHNMWYITWRK